MAFEFKDNRGAVFVNNRKTAKIGGLEYHVNGWLHKAKNGAPCLSLSFKPKNASTAQRSKLNSPVELTDSIAF
jgi:hypothetical protein